MLRIFPFGRGKRGSRQRVVFEARKWGGLMVIHDTSIKILQTHGPDVTVLRVGTSVLTDKRRVFFTSQISITFECLLQAVKDFRIIRRINKIKIDKPIPIG